MQKEDKEEEDSGFHYMRQSACLVNDFPFTRIQIPPSPLCFPLAIRRRGSPPSSLQDMGMLMALQIVHIDIH
jgi:hypothetical protein